MKTFTAMFLIGFLAFALGIVFVSSFPIDDPEQKIPNFELTEGDMILTDEQKERLFEGSNTRNGVKDPSFRWPRTINVYYLFASSISFDERTLIFNSLRDIERSTCVRFYEGSNSENHFIGVTNNEPNCFAKVGYQRTPAQRLNLGKGCMSKGQIIHEFLHALGFYHQQNSANRDTYVKINWENVQPGQEHNFNKYSSVNFGIAYDYGSILHGGPYEWSKNGKPTMTVKIYNEEQIGQRNGLSSSDILKINRMYGC